MEKCFRNQISKFVIDQVMFYHQVSMVKCVNLSIKSLQTFKIIIMCTYSLSVGTSLQKGCRSLI